MTAIVDRDNMWRALRAVERNRGSAGVDGMSWEQLRPWLKDHWPEIKEQLLAGRYRPQAVRKVLIPKPGGKGQRTLGIPTVLDRLIQQATAQVLGPKFDPDFSDSSYGFRPGRSAHQAVQSMREHVRSGRRWVVDMDLEKFFDHVNHDVLMARVRRKVGDKRVLRLIRRYLQAGMMDGGLMEPRRQGTPQGGPLSPLLSNILLDELDKELEKRGHCFCRYADDVNVYVRSRRAGERVLASLTEWLGKHLKLKVNGAKSAVDRPWNRVFLGYSLTSHRQARLKVAKQSLRRLRQKAKTLFRQGKGRNVERFIREDLNPLLRGWSSYFRHSEVKGALEESDQWLRRRLRCMLWRQWKRPRTRRRKLMALGLDEARASESAFNGRGPWWNSGASHANAAMPRKFFDLRGLLSVLDSVRFYASTS
jgi:RNA-directed DNA polymerase